MFIFRIKGQRTCRVHLSRLNFHCYSCDNKSSTYEQMCRHILCEHYGLSAWRCKICGFTVRKKKSLIVHYENKHVGSMVLIHNLLNDFRKDFHILLSKNQTKFSVKFTPAKKLPKARVGDEEFNKKINKSTGKSSKQKSTQSGEKKAYLVL